MLIRLRDLTALSVQDADGAKHRVTDLLVERETPTVTHVVTRLGRWLDRHGCAMRIDAFGAPDLSENTWPATVGEQHIREQSGPVATVCGADAAPDPADVAAADETPPLVALSTIDEKPVKAADGATVGRVMDMVIDPLMRKVTMVVIHAGPSGTEHQRVVPVDVFERIDWEAGTVHLRCGAEPVENAPDLHEMGDRIESHWYNRVLAYYGIG